MYFSVLFQIYKRRSVSDAREIKNYPIFILFYFFRLTLYRDSGRYITVTLNALKIHRNLIFPRNTIFPAYQ